MHLACQIMTIGWDVGKLEELSLEETRRRIEESYPDSDPAMVSGMIRRFTDIEEAKKVLSAGFEYVTQKDGIMLFRRPKRFC